MKILFITAIITTVIGMVAVVVEMTATILEKKKEKKFWKEFERRLP